MLYYSNLQVVFQLFLKWCRLNLHEKLPNELEIPTIGIGAGVNTSGQVLVLQDLLGVSKDFNPKFLRKYLNGYDLIMEAVNHYNSDVKENKYPSEKESY
jgi:3-methyl-2-oxobutanoate hydroxymethyltransferase